ncbi:NACHT domain-containing protein [Streptomyces zagrosensis]|uniref:Transcriptional regulator with XRE-family HTH domain/energy-coupling factor transporter ATP-binding protein EcfA2 n=1 Tax=Streptomyces zagrosensis TaxID=1042984 RepID=A0A7W9UW88_9ACTN|nr:NACHT domain-containing protein [Streptomyces zagrosensis]MBB5933061.1 transcriptional regulator with XRE-family HTH domain/energy-coupling factor transporter ATP-binding protein EcfA2 [Streptomyces zagrosensis]
MAADEPLERLSTTLHAARMKRRMSMAAVTTRSELGRTTVSQAFNGRSVPSEETLVALARALGLEAGSLLALRTACVGSAGTAPRRRAQVGAGAVVQSQGAGLRTEDIQFEARYRDYLRERHGQLTVVGLDLRGDAQAWWPLDAAYLSLELAERDHGRGGDAFAAGQQRAERAELALAGRQRVLIRGLAGSGKTTLLQWLACATASGELPDPLRDLRGSVAYLLPLRTFSRRGELPVPSRFLTAVGCAFAEAQPEGWADRVLASGRGLILVDGLDEVPGAFRERAGTWLKELVAAYGRSRVVVTTRPTAVPEHWLQEARFSELVVRPMSRTDVGVFVSRWHTAARKGAANSDVRAHLDVLEKDLRDKVRAKRDLALLTTTPLLCALICALHRDRRGQLPHDRVEVYEAALSMLLYRRDQEREVHRPEGIALGERESIQLLQKLAYWLTLNGQTELATTTAASLVGDALTSMSPVAEQGDAAAILGHLMGRSGLLRAPTEDTVDFVHRTFQDFLGAKAAVEGYHLPLIVKNAHDEQWEDVVRMAVAHARPGERAMLLGGIIERADQETEHRTRLWLLALACLQHATELDASIRSAIETRAASLLPPRSMIEADVLSEVGPVVLDLLPPPSELDEDEKQAVICVAQHFGEDAALAYLTSFKGVQSGRVRAALAADWGRFDAQEYVTEVLKSVPGPYDLVFLEDPRQARAIAALDVSGVLYAGNQDARQLSHWPHAQALAFIALANNQTITDLNWCTSFPLLGSLGLYSCANLHSLDGLRHTKLTGLTLNEMPADLDVRVLRHLPTLRDLAIHTELPYRDLAELPIHDDLRSLEVGRKFLLNAKIDGLSRWSSLTRLALPGTWFGMEFAEIMRLPRLTTLELSDIALEPQAPIVKAPRLPGITHLRFSTASRECDLSLLAERFPSARSIVLQSLFSGSSADLAPLADLADLRRLTLDSFHQVSGASLFRDGVVRISPTPRQ